LAFGVGIGLGSALSKDLSAARSDLEGSGALFAVVVFSALAGAEGRAAPFELGCQFSLITSLFPTYFSS
jgi:hypothetical protein